MTVRDETGDCDNGLIFLMLFTGVGITLLIITLRFNVAGDFDSLRLRVLDCDCD